MNEEPNLLKLYRLLAEVPQLPPPIAKFSALVATGLEMGGSEGGAAMSRLASITQTPQAKKARAFIEIVKTTHAKACGELCEIFAARARGEESYKGYDCTVARDLVFKVMRELIVYGYRNERGEKDNVRNAAMETLDPEAIRLAFPISDFWNTDAALIEKEFGRG